MNLNKAVINTTAILLAGFSLAGCRNDANEASITRDENIIRTGVIELGRSKPQLPPAAECIQAAEELGRRTTAIGSFTCTFGNAIAVVTCEESGHCKYDERKTQDKKQQLAEDFFALKLLGL